MNENARRNDDTLQADNLVIGADAGLEVWTNEPGNHFVR